MGEFSEQRYYEGYKAVRNRFRKYDARGLITGCLRYLHKPAKDKLQQLQKHPWLVLLLIKWVLMDEQSAYSGKPEPSDGDVLKTLQLMHSLGEKTRLPNEFEHYTLFFRAIAYQQFIYQEDFAVSHLARQFIIFADLPKTHLFQAKFHELVGLEIQSFLELAVVLLVRFWTQDQGSISPVFFASLKHKYGDREVELFLSTFTKSFSEIRALLLERHNAKYVAAEYYEQTPFLAFPLIRNASEYLCIERHILFRCLEHFIYDRMKQWDAQRFMNAFGLIFERHVEKAIKYTGLPYINEDEVKRLVGEKGKLIDFIIADGEANVFVDAKAVEMAYQGKVAHLSEVVKDKAQSIIKAIEQAHDVMSRLDGVSKAHPVASAKANNYLLVITFKDLYLGNGPTLYEGVAKEAIDAIYAKYEGGPVIPLENMYFLSIAEFEEFAEAIHTRNIGMTQGLEKAKADDAHPQTMKFGFKLHLASWNLKRNLPDYLQKRFGMEIDKLKDLMN